MCSTFTKLVNTPCNFYSHIFVLNKYTILQTATTSSLLYINVVVVVVARQKPEKKSHNFTGKNMRSGSILKIINIWAAPPYAAKESAGPGWPPSPLSLSHSPYFSLSLLPSPALLPPPPSLPYFLPPSFRILVFQASETPPCVRLHSVPRAAQAWQSVSKVGGRPCHVAWIGYKLPARAAEELRWTYSIHFSSNPTIKCGWASSLQVWPS